MPLVFQVLSTFIFKILSLSRKLYLSSTKACFEDSQTLRLPDFKHAIAWI